jgi:hypothetical protein
MILFSNNCIYVIYFMDYGVMSTLDLCTLPCEIEHLWAGFSSSTTRDLATVLLISAVVGWVLFIIVAVITCVFSSQIADLKSQIDKSNSSEEGETEDQSQREQLKPTLSDSPMMIQFQKLRLLRTHRHNRTW